MRLNTLTIIGVGLIGGSVGLAARRRGLARKVIGCCRDGVVGERARQAGAIDSFTLDLGAAVRDADLVIYCTPVHLIVRQALSVIEAYRNGAVITDAGSTKGSIVRDLDAMHGTKGLSFVGSHPLAGSEKRGIDHANENLFDGKTTILTPTARTQAPALELVAQFWQGLGCVIKLMDPETHDRSLAVTSHLPHLAASALAGILPPGLQSLAASGFRDTTRIAAGDPELWTAIFKDNAPALLAALDQFTDRLAQYRQAIESGDTAMLEQLLFSGKKIRDSLGN